MGAGIGPGDTYKLSKESKMATSYTYNPFRELDRLFSQMSSATANTRTMPMDLYREGDTFTVKMDLPGVDPDSIDIDVDDRTLTVRAERHGEEIVEKDEKNQWISRERTFGTYARQLTLGTGLDLGRIQADYADGVLTLNVPVAEEAKPRKVQVRTGNKMLSGEVSGVKTEQVEPQTEAHQQETEAKPAEPVGAH